MATTRSALGDHEDLVTVSIRRKVRPGREDVYEQGLASVLAEAATLPGTRGATVLALGGAPATYQVLLHFGSDAGRDEWAASPIRQRWLARLDELTIGLPEIEHLDAQHAWLVQPSAAKVVPPPRPKVALLTWVGIYPVITVLLAVLGERLQPLPLLARTFVLTACAIPLMTWVVMPVVTRLAKSWLVPRDRSAKTEYTNQRRTR